MSTDETRPQGATSEPGGPADARPVGPDAESTGPAHEPATDPATGPAADPAPVAPGQRPYPESGFFASIRRGLFPRSEQRWVGGVAGGIAERIGWDPLLVRGLLILSFFLGGLGLILYGIGWALLPERDGRIHLQEATRGNFDVAMLGSVAVFLVGFAWGGPLGWWDDGGGWEWLGFLFWIAVLGVVFYLIVQGVQRARDNSAARRSGYAGPPAQGVPTPGVPTPGAPAHGAPTAGMPAGPAAPRPGEPGAPAPFTPAPPVDYRRSDGLVYATGAGPAPYRQTQPQYRPAPVPLQPVYTAPPARVRRGPGGATVGVTLGVILLAGALLLAADRVGATDFIDSGYAGAGTVWLGISTIVLGVAILVSGLRGRSSGWLGFFAIVALLLGAGYITVVGSDARDWAEDATVTGREIEALVSEPNNPDATTLTEGTVAVQTIREAEDGFYVQWGDPTIDLSELNLSKVEPGDPVVVPIQLGAGQTVVIVPQDVAVEADAYVAAGSVQWNVDDQDRSATGVDTVNDFQSDEVYDGGAVLHLEIQAGAGEVIVSESRGGNTP